MIQEWERLCFIQQEMKKLQHWMISTFPITASKWTHPDAGVFTIQETSLKETTKLKEIRGFDKRLLSPAPHYLEPYTMLNIFTYVHDAMQEVKQLQTDHGDGNVLLGIGRALGATIESLAKLTKFSFAFHLFKHGFFSRHIFKF